MLALLTTAFEIPVIELTGGLDVAAMTSRKIYHRSAYIIQTRSRCHRFVISERWSVCFSQMRDLSGADDQIDALREKLRKAEERADRAREDRERASADRERASADREKATADLDLERARADRERASADRERATADRERARADEQEEIVNLMKGKRWVIFSDLEQAHEDISDSTTLCLGNGYAHPYLKSLRPILEDTKLVSKTNTSLPRSPVGTLFVTDVFGTVRSSVHDLAHCVPHSRRLSEIWYPVIESMLGQSLFYMNSPKDVVRLEGYSKKNKDRYLHSGLTHQPTTTWRCVCREHFLTPSAQLRFAPTSPAWKWLRLESGEKVTVHCVSPAMLKSTERSGRWTVKFSSVPPMTRESPEL